MLGRRFGTSEMHLSPSGLGCCPFKGSGSLVVDSLLIVTPIVGFCNCSTICLQYEREANSHHKNALTVNTSSKNYKFQQCLIIYILD